MARDREEREDEWRRLMTLACGGDNDAYTELLTEISGFLKAYFSKSLRQWGDIDDCVQDCMIRLHQARFSYDTSRPFMPWFFTIVRHKAIDHVRKKARRLEKEILQTKDVDFGSDKSEKEASNRITLMQLLDRLSDEYREPIVLTRVNGLSEKEAAAKLGIKNGALRVRVHRGIKQLRLLVRQQAEKDEQENCNISME